MTTPASPSYAGHRFPAEVISHAVWLYFRFPLSLRMVEEMLAARGIIVSHGDCREIGGQAAAATLGSASFTAKKRCPKRVPQPDPQSRDSPRFTRKLAVPSVSAVPTRCPARCRSA